MTGDCSYLLNLWIPVAVGKGEERFYYEWSQVRPQNRTWSFRLIQVWEIIEIRWPGPGTRTSSPVPPFTGQPLGGVSQVGTGSPFHTPSPYHAFLNAQSSSSGGFCEICRGYGDPPRHYPVLQKYSSVPNTMYYEFCHSSGYNTDKCRALDALVDRLDRSSFRIADGSMTQGGGHDRGGGGGFRGVWARGRGGPPRCFNCNEVGHIAWDCPLPRRPWCSHCRVNTHSTEDCPELIAKWEDRNRQHADNLINSKPRLNFKEDS